MGVGVQGEGVRSVEFGVCVAVRGFGLGWTVDGSGLGGRGFDQDEVLVEKRNRLPRNLFPVRQVQDLRRRTFIWRRGAVGESNNVFWDVIWSWWPTAGDAGRLHALQLLRPHLAADVGTPGG